MGPAGAPPPPPPGSPPPTFDLSYMQSTTKDKYDGMDLPSLYPEEPATMSAALCIGQNLPASLRTLLPRMPRHEDATDEQYETIVAELVEAAKPCEEAVTDAEQACPAPVWHRALHVTPDRERLSTRTDEAVGPAVHGRPITPSAASSPPVGPRRRGPHGGSEDSATGTGRWDVNAVLRPREVER